MDKNEFDVDIHFKLKILFLRCFSTWWTESKSIWTSILERSLSAIRITLMILASILQFIQLCRMTNLKGVSEIVEVMTLTISSSYKSVFFLYNQKHYAAMLNLMRHMFYEQPKVIIKREKYTSMTKFLQFTDLIVWLYLISTFIFVTLAILAAIFVPEIENFETSCQENPTSFEFDSACLIEHNLNPSLPLKTWLPFDYSWTPLYQIISLVNILISYDCCLMYIVQDAFFFTVLYAISGQFQILEENLTNLSVFQGNGKLQRNLDNPILKKAQEENCLQDKILPDANDLKRKEIILHKLLGECVQQHIFLLKLLRDYEKLMGSMIIVDFLHSIISLSFALLEISVAQTMIHTIKLVGFIAISIGHQYMNNYFGEMVIQKQINIAQAVYSLPWEEYPKKLKSSILLMLQRTETPVVLNGFKMYILCYKTFVEFMKAIISYYTVLRNLNQEK